MRGSRMTARSVALLGAALILALNPGAAAAHGAAPGFITIDAGQESTCGLRSDGTVWCWGSRLHGELGDGLVGGSSTVPVQVQTASGALAGVSQLSVGNQHACALLGDGSAWCWGRNDHGQVGPGWASGAEPFAVRMTDGGAALPAIREVSANALLTLALLETGSVRCWGSSDLGQCGDGTTGYGNQRIDPVTVRSATGPIRRIVAISAGGGQHCALRDDATAWCWGWNRWGAVGDGTAGNLRTLAVKVRAADGSVLRGITAIAAGEEHTCALLTGGEAWCWGGARLGRLGVGTTGGPDGRILHPVRVRTHEGALAPVTAIDLYRSTCALKPDGSAWCWGPGRRGQLGDGTRSDRLLPVRVRTATGPLTDLLDLSIQRAHACAVDGQGRAWCWGANDRGQLGDGTRTDRLVAVRVVMP